MSQVVTKPVALDETLQATNTALGLLGKDTTLQSIVTALASIGVNTVGNLASLITTDKTSLVGAVNEVAGDVSDLDTGKADKVSGATNGNLAGLDANGNLTDSGISAGNTSISSIGDGTLTGAVSAENGAIEAIVDVYGSKNLLQISATSGTVDNVQYTVNSDGSISASGLANGSAIKTIATFSLPIGIYKINGCGDIEHLYCTLRNNADDSYIANLTDDDYILTVNNSSFVYKIQMQTSSGKNINDTLYPMIRDTRISDNSYAPYAMTNRELTERKANIEDSLPIIDWTTETGSTDKELMVRALCRYIADNKKTGIFVFEMSGMTDGIAISGFENSGITAYDVMFCFNNGMGTYSARFVPQLTLLRVWDASGNVIATTGQ